MSVRLAVALVAAMIGSGCIRSATLITVKPDGSGTIEQSVLMNTAALKGMLGGLGAPGQGASSGAIDENAMRQTATRMGEGVTFVSSEPVKAADGFEGAKALYAFTDISKVRVDQDPNISGSSTGVSAAPKEDNPVTFAMTRSGGVSNLTVTFNDKPARDKAATTPAGGPQMDNPQMTEMMKTMFKGFKVNIDLQVAGAIVKTNADHVDGNTVTLLEMDLEALLADEAKLKEVQKVLGPNASVAELKPYLKDIKGLKINDPVVTIAFK
ncbi:MAG: hypothetical protein AB7U83_12460 [Vicinamibacterales bacterium]